MQGIMAFSEGEMVGRVSEFETESNFLNELKEEWGLEFDDESADNVERRFVRFYLNPPGHLKDEFPDGCYTFSKPSRGAFEVFVIER